MLVNRQRAMEAEAERNRQIAMRMFQSSRPGAVSQPIEPLRSQIQRGDTEATADNLPALVVAVIVGALIGIGLIFFL